jgi:hypothetical protein
MPRYLTITVGEVTGRMRLLDEEAPKTAQAIWDILPIEDQTIPVQWSGSAWRSEKNYVFEGVGMENLPERLSAGQLAYYPSSKKICFAYGDAQWKGSHGELRDLNLVGQSRHPGTRIATGRWSST